MAYTYSRAHTVFLAGETAPSPEQVIEDGILIPNDLGNIALTLRQIDKANSRAVELDTNVDPPVLRFKNARILALFGNTNHEGEFVPYDNEASRTITFVDGDYSGPGSELELS